MRTGVMAISFLLLGASLFLTLRAAAQTGQEDPPPKPEIPVEQMVQLEEFVKLSLPGQFHEHLEYFIGDWNTVSKVYMGGPGTPALESKGQSTFRWVLGKRFIEEHHAGSFMGEAYEGLGLIGYDNVRSLYVATWASNRSTQISRMKGWRDAGGKVYTFYGELDQPGVVLGAVVKYVRRIVDKDQFIFEMINLHQGEEYKVAEITYQRAKDSQD